MDGTIAELRTENGALRAQIAGLLAQGAKLEADLAAAGKHPGNSSKPPSSDIAKPSRPKRDKDQKKR